MNTLICQNPFIEALPPPLSSKELLSRLGTRPTLPELSGFRDADRRVALNLLNSFFFPLDYMASVYTTVYNEIVGTYMTQATFDTIERIHQIRLSAQPMTSASGVQSSAILGVPGIGKTSTIRRCLQQIPQVIRHTEYQGQPMLCAQVTYLVVECPCDCSVKTLAISIVDALDRAAGTEYAQRYLARASLPSASALITQVKALCLIHHVGLIVIDEIQNAVTTAARSNQDRPLIKFLVELTNECCTNILFAGTLTADKLFCSQEHLKRRTRGLRLLPMRPDGVYYRFLQALWPYQVTVRKTQLTDGLANTLYDLSGGVPAYIIQVFRLAQQIVLEQGDACIDRHLLNRAGAVVGASLPKTYEQGQYLSDFTAEDSDAALPPAPYTPVIKEIVPQPHATNRGRPRAKRDKGDILALAEGINNCIDIFALLQDAGLVEVVA